MSLSAHTLAAVILDMDGTMVDTETVYHAAWRNTAEQLGFTLGDDLLHETTGKRTADCYAVIQSKLGQTFPMDEFKANWWKRWQMLVETEGVRQKAGLDRLLSLLEAHNIPRAVATSSARAEALYTLERAGIADRFSIIVTGDQIANGKPAPDIFLLAAERLGVDARACLAVEDSEAGVYAASNAGMMTFMVPDLVHPNPDVATRSPRYTMFMIGLKQNG